MGKFDIICDGTDNFDTRYLINDYCLTNKRILISSAINKFDGQIIKFNFKRKVHVTDVLCQKNQLLIITAKPKVYFLLLQA